MIKSEEEEKDRTDDGLSWANELNRNLSWKEKMMCYCMVRKGE